MLGGPLDQRHRGGDGPQPPHPQARPRRAREEGDQGGEEGREEGGEERVGEGGEEGGREGDRGREEGRQRQRGEGNQLVFLGWAFLAFLCDLCLLFM